MFIRHLLAEWGFPLPALGLGCLILAGCGTDSTLVDPDDEVVLEPNEVRISPDDQPVSVTATWKSKKEGATFEKWIVHCDSASYSLSIAQEKQPSTTISIRASASLEPNVALHSDTGVISTYADIVAQLKRNGQTKSVSSFLTLYGTIPRVKTRVVNSKGRYISPQEVVVTATVVIEVINAQTQANYSFNLSFFPTTVHLCSPGQPCSPHPLGAPTITSRPTAPGKTGEFQFEQTVKTTSPQTIGDIECTMAASAVSEFGNRAVPIRTVRIIFQYPRL